MKFFKDILNPLRVILWTFLVLLVISISLIIYMFIGTVKQAPGVVFGVTFSQVFAEEMELDWKKVYSAILDDLGVRRLRLIAYWPKVEPFPQRYSFDDLDYQINTAGRKGANIILVVGRKVPRWPECHVPEWASSLSESEQQRRILSLIEQIINRYKENDAIIAWQVENEPFLESFGECPDLDEEFLDKEIDLVRRLDSSRPIIVSSSGELSSWIRPATRANILGTTLYRIVWNSTLGYFKYPIPPIFYHKRANLVKWVTGIDRIIIVELQAEPWGPGPISQMDIGEQVKSMDLDKFRKIVDYTYKTGFDEAYFWGVEWWYWRKELLDYPDIWNEARNLF